MVGEDRVIMSVKELRRVPVIRQVLEKQLPQGQAGEALGLTARHIRRLIQRMRAENSENVPGVFLTLAPPVAHRFDPCCS